MLISKKEIAIVPENWKSLSEDFYWGGKILTSASEQSSRFFRQSLGTVLPDSEASLLEGFNVLMSAKFCLAFSIELLAKSLLISKEPEKYISNDELNFGHDIYSDLKSKVINFSQTEIELIDSLKNLILDGKYPTPKKLSKDPNDNNFAPFDSHAYVHLRSYFELITSIRNKILQAFD